MSFSRSRIVKKALGILFFFALPFAALYSVEMKSVTIAGFINTGEARDASVNVQMTRSLITFLTKFSKNVTPYASLEPAARSFWKMKILDENLAMGIAQSFDTKQVLTGTYRVNNKKETIEINVFVYDVVTGDLKLKRSYKGSAGVEIFDTIDKMIRDVTGLLIGRALDFGDIRVNVLSDKGPHKLFVDGMFAADLTNRKPFLYKTFANSQSAVSIRIASTGRDVLEKTVDVVKDGVVDVTYTPSGTVVIKTAIGTNDVFLNGKESGVIQTGGAGELTMPNIPANVPTTVQIRSEGKIVAEETVTVDEGEIKVVYVGDANQDSRRTVFFPIKGGMLGWLNSSYIQAGADWYFMKDFHAFAQGGVILYNQQPVGFGAVPLVETGVGYTFVFNYLFKAGANVSALLFFGKEFTVMPVATVEIDIWKFFISGGARFSLVDGNFYPVLSAGVKF
jgi:hypothetical protein